jgi:hypothetical protein
MTLQEALTKLGIEDYGERIFNSNSHGELFHLNQYVQLANELKGLETGWFRGWFESVVNEAKETWQRPESVYQHIRRVWVQEFSEYLKSRKANK